MKNLLATTALVVGIGFSAQASDPNDTLAQITEIVAAHYIEANEALQTEVDNIPDQIAEALDNQHTQWVSNLQYYSYDSGDNREVETISDLVDSIIANIWSQVDYVIADRDALRVELDATQATLEAERAYVAERYEEIVQDIEQLNEQLAVQEALRNYYELTALENAEVIAVQQDQIADLQNSLNDAAHDLDATLWQLEDTEAQLAEIWNEINGYHNNYDITYGGALGPVDAIFNYAHTYVEGVLGPIIEDLQAQLAETEARHEDELAGVYAAAHSISEGSSARIEELEAQLATAQADAQEASNRANVNAQNATAWYEEAQRLQALLDAQE